MGAVDCVAAGEGGETGGQDGAGEVCAEGEGGFGVALVVLVEALGVEEVDVGWGDVGYFYYEAVGWRSGKGDRRDL